MHDLRMWPDTLPDAEMPSKTPGKSKDANDRMSQLAKVTMFEN